MKSLFCLKIYISPIPVNSTHREPFDGVMTPVTIRVIACALTHSEPNSQESRVVCASKQSGSSDSQ